MALTQMQVFNDYIMPATIERLAQMVSQFNAASNNSIRLTTEGFDGDFLQESFFQSVHSAQRRVNRYGTNASASETDLTELKRNSVKVAGGFGPIRFEPSQFSWLQRPTAQGIQVASDNFAEAMLRDQLNTAVAALCAAIGNQSAAVAGEYPTDELNQRLINKSHALFGDHSQDLVAQVMDGFTYHKLVGDNLANEQRLFVAQGVRVVDILGKAVVVTDAPALFEEGSSNNELKVLSLAESAAIVFDSGDVVSNIDTKNGKQRIETTMQVDYSFGLGIKGYDWSGAKSPTDVQLSTGSNWDKVVTSIKHTAGVLAVGADELPE